MHKYFLYSLLLFFVLPRSFGQNTKHVVQKGENVYRISLKYGVSMNAIFDANPGSREVIKVGEALIIPLASQNRLAANTSSNSYVVKKGETKFGLSKRFGISISQLEKDNPQIVNGLQAGHVLNISSVSNRISSSTSPVNSNSNNSVSTGFHRIEKGETLWSISQKYNTTVSILRELNPNITITEIGVGQEIKIPSSKTTYQNSSADYVVQKGDTKYGLSKRFAMSIAQLESLNPDIKNGLIPGQQLKLKTNSDTAEARTQQEVTSNTAVTTSKPVISGDEDYVLYTIKPKETVYALSKMAGMSQSEFLTLNPQLNNGVNAGTVIKMPANAKQQPLDISETETTTIAKEDSKASGLYKTALKEKTVEVTWILPFLEDQFSTKKVTLSSDEVTDVTNALDFYKGGMAAIKHLRSEGFTIKEASGSVEELSRLNSPKSGLLISSLPLSTLKSDGFSTSEFDILLNSNFKTKYNTDSKAVAFNPLGSIEDRASALIDHIASKNGNIIVINDSKQKATQDLISELNPASALVEVKPNDNFKESDLIENLSSNKPNYIIINSDKASVFLNTTNALLRQFSNYDIHIAVLDKALIPSGEYISSKRFRILRLIFPSVYKMDASELNKLSEDYKSTYRTTPSEAYYLGYDATQDALLRLLQPQPVTSIVNVPNTAFDFMDFRYESTSSGQLTNTAILIYQYGRDSGYVRIN